MYIFIAASTTAFLAYFAALLVRAPERNATERIELTVPTPPNWPSGSQAFPAWAASSLPIPAIAVWLKAQRRFLEWRLWKQQEELNSRASVLSNLLYRGKMRILRLKESFLREETIHLIQRCTYKQYITMKVEEVFASKKTSEDGDSKVKEDV